VDVVVRSDQNHPFRLSLGYKQSIKRVPMEKRELHQRAQVGLFDIEPINIICFPLFFQLLKPAAPQLNLAQTPFDRDFPKGDGTDMQLCLGIQKHVPDSLGKGGMVREEPKQGVGI